MVLAINGPRRVKHPTAPNVGESERAVSVILGSVLAAGGLKRRGLDGLAMAIAGAELVRRGATGHCMVYDAIGFSSANADAPRSEGRSRYNRLPATSRPDVRGAAATVNARKSIKIERSIIIRRPRQEVYEFWREFRNLPRFLDHLVSVTDLGNGRSHWIARGPGDVRVVWDAEIVNDLPRQLIAWKTIGNPDVAHAGSVHFTDAPGRGTKVRLVMDYEPPGGRVAAVMTKIIGDSPDQKIRDDLRRLKAILETNKEGWLVG